MDVQMKTFSITHTHSLLSFPLYLPFSVGVRVFTTLNELTSFLNELVYS
jgi:hypothetical protein